MMNGSSIILRRKRSNCDAHGLTIEGGAGFKQTSEIPSMEEPRQFHLPISLVTEIFNGKGRITVCEHKYLPKRRKTLCLWLFTH